MATFQHKINLDTSFSRRRTLKPKPLVTKPNTNKINNVSLYDDSSNDIINILPPTPPLEVSVDIFDLLPELDLTLANSTLEDKCTINNRVPSFALDEGSNSKFYVTDRNCEIKSPKSKWNDYSDVEDVASDTSDFEDVNIPVKPDDIINLNRLFKKTLKVSCEKLDVQKFCELNGFKKIDSITVSLKPVIQKDLESLKLEKKQIIKKLVNNIDENSASKYLAPTIIHCNPVTSSNPCTNPIVIYPVTLQPNPDTNAAFANSSNLPINVSNDHRNIEYQPILSCDTVSNSNINTQTNENEICTPIIDLNKSDLIVSPFDLSMYNLSDLSDEISLGDNIQDIDLINIHPENSSLTIYEKNNLNNIKLSSALLNNLPQTANSEISNLDLSAHDKSFLPNTLSFSGMVSKDDNTQSLSDQEPITLPVLDVPISKKSSLYKRTKTSGSKNKVEVIENWSTPTEISVEEKRLSDIKKEMESFMLSAKPKPSLSYSKMKAAKNKNSSCTSSKTSKNKRSSPISPKESIFFNKPLEQYEQCSTYNATLDCLLFGGDTDEFIDFTVDDNIGLENNVQIKIEPIEPNECDIPSELVCSIVGNKEQHKKKPLKNPNIRSPIRIKVHHSFLTFRKPKHKKHRKPKDFGAYLKKRKKRSSPKRKIGNNKPTCNDTSTDNTHLNSKNNSLLINTVNDKNDVIFNDRTLPNPVTSEMLNDFCKSPEKENNNVTGNSFASRSNGRKPKEVNPQKSDQKVQYSATSEENDISKSNSHVKKKKLKSGKKKSHKLSSLGNICIKQEPISPDPIDLKSFDMEIETNIEPIHTSKIVEKELSNPVIELQNSEILQNEILDKETSSVSSEQISDKSSVEGKMLESNNEPSNSQNVIDNSTTNDNQLKDTTDCDDNLSIDSFNKTENVKHSELTSDKDFEESENFDESNDIEMQIDNENESNENNLESKREIDANNSKNHAFEKNILMDDNAMSDVIPSIKDDESDKNNDNVNDEESSGKILEMDLKLSESSSDSLDSFVVVDDDDDVDPSKLKQESEISANNINESTSQEIKLGSPNKLENNVETIEPEKDLQEQKTDLNSEPEKKQSPKLSDLKVSDDHSPEKSVEKLKLSFVTPSNDCGGDKSWVVSSPKTEEKKSNKRGRPPKSKTHYDLNKSAVEKSKSSSTESTSKKKVVKNSNKDSNKEKKTKSPDKDSLIPKDVVASDSTSHKKKIPAKEDKKDDLNKEKTVSLKDDENQSVPQEATQSEDDKPSRTSRTKVKKRPFSPTEVLTPPTKKTPLPTKVKTPVAELKSPAVESSGSQKKKAKRYDAELVVEPFKIGWMRELVHRATTGRSKQSDVYYFTPEGNKLRSMPEIGKYLADHTSSGLTLDNFTFAKETIYRQPFEKERDANVKFAAPKDPSDTTPVKKKTPAKKNLSAEKVKPVVDLNDDKNNAKLVDVDKDKIKISNTDKNKTKNLDVDKSKTKVLDADKSKTKVSDTDKSKIKNSNTDKSKVKSLDIDKSKIKTPELDKSKTKKDSADVKSSELSSELLKPVASTSTKSEKKRKLSVNAEPNIAKRKTKVETSTPLSRKTRLKSNDSISDTSSTKDNSEKTEKPQSKTPKLNSKPNKSSPIIKVKFTKDKVPPNVARGEIEDDLQQILTTPPVEKPSVSKNKVKPSAKKNGIKIKFTPSKKVPTLAGKIQL